MAKDPAHEASLIADEIKDLHEQHGVPYGDIAVLMRVFNKSYMGGGRVQTHYEVQLALKRRQIPYVVSRGSNIFERADVQDILAYLR